MRRSIPCKYFRPKNDHDGHMSGYLHYLNGEYVAENKLLISPRDLGFSRGYGVFDYLRTYNGRPFKLEEHLARFLRSASAIELKHDYNLKQLIEIIRTTLEKNNDGKEKQLKVILSGGISTSMHIESRPTLIVIIDPFKPKKPEIYVDGIKMNLVKFMRYKPGAKNTNYIEGIIQTERGGRDECYEPLYYGDFQVYEGSNSNIFAVKEKKIYTPKSNVFCGGTRGVLVGDLKNELHVIEQDFDLPFLLDADEAFICSSGKEIVGVVKLDNHIIGNGKVGEITKLVHRIFRDYVDSGKWIEN